MNKPKGGRGQKAPYETKLMRVPIPLEKQINQLVELYRNHLEANPEADPNKTPNLTDQSHNQLKSLIEELETIIKNHADKKAGYLSNSFGQGIKHLKQIVNSLKLVNK